VLAERKLARALKPVTSPTVKRALLSGRDGLAGGVARVRAASWRPRLRPDFLIVGAQKAGTTFLYQELIRHPNVLPALTKEIHYFDDRYARWRNAYAGFFPAVPRAAGRSRYVTGEASPGYVFHPHAARRIASDLPDAKLVLLVRDPVVRAHSQYLHERRLGFEDAPTFAEALAREEERLDGELERMLSDDGYVSFSWRHHSYHRRGQYLDQVLRAEAAVGADRLLVLRSEDLFRDPIGAVAMVAGFLGLPPWTPDAVGPNDMRSGAGAPIDPDVERQLRAHFRPYNDALAAHLGRDLRWDA
jgi:hypothetical protein